MTIHDFITKHPDEHIRIVLRRRRHKHRHL